MTPKDFIDNGRSVPRMPEEKGTTIADVIRPGLSGELQSFHCGICGAAPHQPCDVGKHTWARRHAL